MHWENTSQTGPWRQTKARTRANPVRFLPCGVGEVDLPRRRFFSSVLIQLRKAKTYDKEAGFPASLSRSMAVSF